MYNTIAVITVDVTELDNIQLTNDNDFIPEVYRVFCTIYNDCGYLVDSIESYIRPLLNPHFTEEFIIDKDLENVEFENTLINGLETINRFLVSNDVKEVFVERRSVLSLLTDGKKLFSDSVQESLKYFKTVYDNEKLNISQPHNKMFKRQSLVAGTKDIAKRNSMIASDLFGDYFTLLKEFISMNIFLRIGVYNTLVEKILNEEVTDIKDLLMNGLDGYLDMINFSNYVRSALIKNYYKELDKMIDLNVTVTLIKNKLLETVDIETSDEIKSNVFGGYLDEIRKHKTRVK